MSTHPVIGGVRVAAAAAVLTAAAAAQAPTQEAPRAQTPIRTQANYVRVDAYPTADGRPVIDLRADDFELTEDDAPQTITAFEHVVVSPAGPQAERLEPQTIEASRQAASNPRHRVFIVFLDAPHATIEGTWHVREPLIRLMNQILGPDDLVGIMTPEMAPQDMVVARRTEVIEKALRDGWPWGYRHTLQQDDREWDYDACYPENAFGDLAKQMTERRRERMTLEAISDLVRYLRDLREERKAILTVSDGWLLYRENPDLLRLRKSVFWEEPVPGKEPIGIGPGGKITFGEPNNAPSGLTKTSCDTDRMRLAHMDNNQYFRMIVEDANRANASFYTIDPRGLAAWDTPLGPEKPLPMLVDQAHLRKRIETIRTLAEATDGVAVIGNNDLNVGMKRIADDLTSYYLLGYYSTNTKLDGTFRTIRLRVKRPGVAVRARRGYRAPTEAEVTAARAAAAPAPASADTSAVTTAFESLARIRPEARFRLHAVPAAAAAGQPASLVWIAGEMQHAPATDPWSKGGTVAIVVSAGEATATARVALAAGERTFLTAVRLPAPLAGSGVKVRAELTGADPDAAPLADSLHVTLTPGARRPLLFRRGPATGNRLVPAADFLFRRSERLRVELPVPAGARPQAGRLLDRAGQPLPIPVALTMRADAERHWIVGDVTLAPLGAGDYAVEIAFAEPESAGVHKAFATIRVTR